MHPLCTPSELEERILNESWSLWNFRVQAKHYKKSIRFVQLMRSINMKAKNTCGITTCTSEFCHGNKKRIMRRAKLNRL